MTEVRRSYRTPLARARGSGSAKHGVTRFIGERVSSIALVFLMLWGVWSALKLAPVGYVGAVAWLHSPVHATLLVLLLATGFYHTELGMRVIIEDYIHVARNKALLLILNTFVAYAALVLAVLSVLKVAFTPLGAV